jgi:hypothetical protein
MRGSQKSTLLYGPRTSHRQQKPRHLTYIESDADSVLIRKRRGRDQLSSREMPSIEVSLGGVWRSSDESLEARNEAQLWFLDGKLHREDGPAIVAGERSIIYLRDEGIYLHGSTKAGAETAQFYFRHGKLHRQASEPGGSPGPAVIIPEDAVWSEDDPQEVNSFEPGPAKLYYQDGKLHREDGPAYEGPDGNYVYWVQGKLHREGGPAVCRDGIEEYYLNGTQRWL